MPMTLLRAIGLSLLTCVMTLTGIGAATARGHMAADGVICTSGSYTVILAADGLPLFDSGGNPVEAQDVPCLDCVFGQLAVAPSTAELSVNELPSSDLVPLSLSVLSAELWRMGGNGRSPPFAA